RGVALSIIFFQAEDGIRDRSVTGLQTCALPISGLDQVKAGQLINAKLDIVLGTTSPPRWPSTSSRRPVLTACSTKSGWPSSWTRSEERRVGKEGRCGRPPDQ